MRLADHLALLATRLCKIEAAHSQYADDSPLSTALSVEFPCITCTEIEPLSSKALLLHDKALVYTP